MNPHVIRAQEVKNPSLRFFVLHHAGGTALNYFPWAEHFPSDWDVCLLDYPGRNMTLDKATRKDMPSLSAHMREVIAKECRDGVPYALFGHSMGSVVAFEIIRQQSALQGRLPVWLGVSAAAAPHSDTRKRMFMRRNLSDEALIQELRFLGGTDERLIANQSLRTIFFNLIRADFAVLETYDCQGPTPLDVPITGFIGLEDGNQTTESIEEWRQLTRKSFRCHSFAGGHFYFKGQEKTFVPLLVDEVRQQVQRLAHRELEVQV